MLEKAGKSKKFHADEIKPIKENRLYCLTQSLMSLDGSENFEY